MKKILVLALFLISTSLMAKDIEHLRLIWHDKPSSETYVAWTTKGLVPPIKNRVYFDTVSHKGDLKSYRYKKKAFIQKPYTYGLSMLHGVKLKGLMPNTKYYFVVKSGKDVTKEFNFVTAPVGRSDFSLFFGGDSRSDREKRREMNIKMKNMLEANPRILALVHGGDYVANGLNWKQWKMWMDDHQLTTTSDNRMLPIIPTRGNHEISLMLFNDIFLFPGKGLQTHYFRSRLGELSIITLNSNCIIGGPQKRWLKKQLEQASVDSKWIVANYHRPAWPAVKKPGRTLKHWVPLFEDFQVDLVFESDGHTLKRTAPIFRNKIDHEKGITYVGEGGLGVQQRSPKHADKWYFNSPGYAVSNHHVLTLDVSGEKMIYSVHLDDGRIFDSMTINPRNRLPVKVAKAK